MTTVHIPLMRTPRREDPRAAKVKQWRQHGGWLKRPPITTKEISNAR